MKALTILQPYAHLIAIGEKYIENRTWSTNYRGPLAIHAGKSTRMLSDADREWLGDEMEFGAVIAIADLVDCISMAKLQSENGLTLSGGCRLYDSIRRHEHTEGPWCWELANVRRIEPVKVSGKQGLWDWGK